MDRSVRLGATVNNEGRLIFAEPARFRAWIATARGKHVEVTLERERSRRSNQANSRYWAALVPFAAEVFEQKTRQPFSKDAAHLALKLAFAGHTMMVVAGVEVMVPRSTTKMSTEEFYDYTQRIEAWIQQEFKVNPDLIEADAFL